MAERDVVFRFEVTKPTGESPLKKVGAPGAVFQVGADELFKVIGTDDFLKSVGTSSLPKAPEPKKGDRG
ncbi:MAG: hypothetical protein HYS12_07390 [Planctomycetes bacterium]|nr:hypothetical protein [Planctomycetota bacterium]